MRIPSVGKSACEAGHRRQATPQSASVQKDDVASADRFPGAGVPPVELAKGPHISSGNRNLCKTNLKGREPDPEIKPTLAGDAFAGAGMLRLRHDGHQNPPPVLPDESSVPRKNICLSERQKLSWLSRPAPCSIRPTGSGSRGAGDA